MLYILRLTLGRVRRLPASNALWGRGGGSVGPPSVWSLIEPELCGENERVALDETKPMVYFLGL